MLGSVFDIRGKIAEMHSLNAARVRREKRGRNGYALRAHSGQRGDYHRQGAPAEARQVVKRRNARQKPLFIF
jgi:hypothetical protein